MSIFNAKLFSATVGIAGDWHADFKWALSALDLFAHKGITTIIHLGDFGILPAARGAKYIELISQRLVKNNQTLYIVLGNHEDYSQTNVVPHGSDGTQNFATNLYLLPRNFRWNWKGRSLVALGGANSINYSSLVPQVSWWPEESITLSDIYNVANSGEADIMLAHEAPLGVVPDMTRGEWSYKAVTYAEESSVLMRQALDSVKPKLFMHGHYHTYYDKQVAFNDGLQDYSTRIVGLDMNGHNNNLAVLNIETLYLEILSFETL